MGTSAWMFIESRRTPSDGWRATSEQSLASIVRRDYKLFDALSGGRNGSGFLYPPRGLPLDMSETVFRSVCYRLTDSDDEKKQSKPGALISKRSCYTMQPFGEVIQRDNAEFFYLFNGYHHSYSWLTLEEIIASTRHAGIVLDALDAGYVTILSQMRELENEGRQVRLVFWFDEGPVDTLASRVIEHINEVLVHAWSPNWRRDILDTSNPAEKFFPFVGPVYKILTASRSERELIEYLLKIELESKCSPISSKSHLQQVAVKLLALDVTIRAS